MVFAVTSSLKMSVLFGFFPPVVLLMLQELEHEKLSSKFGLTLFVHVDLCNKNPVCYIVLYVHETFYCVQSVDISVNIFFACLFKLLLQV
jgi:hypothetical protein